MLAPLLGDELAAGDAVAALRRYSLVTPGRGRPVSVHRLVQAVTADQMPAGPGRGSGGRPPPPWSRPRSPPIPACPGTWPVFAALLPHAQAALPADSGGMVRIAHYLGDSGSYAAARELWRGIAGTDRAPKPGPRATRAPCSPGPTRPLDRTAGDAAGARDQFAALLPVRERVSGAEHPDTLAARRDLARWTGEAGDAAGARDQFAALLPVRERVSGAEHPDTLTARWQPRPLDRGGGGCGRGPGPVRRAAARPRARVLAPSTPTP